MQFYCVAIVGPPTGSIKQASAFALAHNSIFHDTKMSPERPLTTAQGRERLRLTDGDIRSIRSVEYLTEDALLERQRKKDRERQARKR